MLQGWILGSREFALYFRDSAATTLGIRITPIHVDIGLRR